MFCVRAAAVVLISVAVLVSAPANARSALAEGNVPLPRPKALLPEAPKGAAGLKPAGETGAIVVDLEALESVTADQPADETHVLSAQAESVSGSVRTKEKDAVDFGAAVTLARDAEAGRPALVPIRVVDQVAPGASSPTTSINVDIQTPMGQF